MKDIIYIGNSRDIIAAFPDKVKQRILTLLDMLRFGVDLHPKDFKYIHTVGKGVYELRVKLHNQYRVFFLTPDRLRLY